MIGSWRWNMAAGAGGALLTLLISLGSNPFLTSIYRGIYAFVIFFLLAYAVRWLIPNLLLPKPAADAQQDAEDEAGAVLDMITPPEEEALTELMKENWSGGRAKPADAEGAAAEFQPLQPKKLVTLDQPDPEQVVEAIRRLTDER